MYRVPHVPYHNPCPKWQNCLYILCVFHVSFFVCGVGLQFTVTPRKNGKFVIDSGYEQLN
jgi:hypothetical protein